MKDTVLLFCTRTLRLFGYGFLSVGLALYLSEIGMSEKQIGLLLALTLAGDAVITLWISSVADRTGRRRMLMAGSFLMIAAGAAFLMTRNFALLCLAAIIGVISPSGNEIGPFLSIEQAALSHIVPFEERTKFFAWYNLVGSFATAIGALVGGWIAGRMIATGSTPLAAYRTELIGYIAVGFVLFVLFLAVSPAVELVRPKQQSPSMGLHKSRGIILRLSSLFALDAFAGGLIVQSMLALWFHLRFGVDIAMLGKIFFGANLLAGISALSAARLAKRFGLINTMVWTHVPSNILLILVPLMPTLPLAIAVLLIRFSISQMDVPTRQSYVMAVVDPDERSAAAGVTGIARSVGATPSPFISGLFMAAPALMSMPFYLAGVLKIIYDFALYRSFQKVKPPEEQKSS